MAVLGAFLAALGVSDLFRASDDATSVRRRIVVLAIGLATLVALLAAAGITGAEWGAAVPLGAALTAWTLGSAGALASGTRALPRGVAFAGLGVGVAICLFTTVDGSDRWPAVLSGPLTAIAFDRVALVFGVAVVQLSTANIIVRLTLEGVGVPTAPGERKLKSGRVLGPMERLFILGLGMTGAFTAAAAVVAAKGLLRYPEVKADSEAVVAGDRPNPVSEYFLIGSFASWLVAVAGLALVGLETGSLVR